ncbi:MAG: hypothetical protein ACYS47_07935 [Planctomycetota bacterium]|jgi:hypothetical protein
MRIARILVALLALGFLLTTTPLLAQEGGGDETPSGETPEAEPGGEAPAEPGEGGGEAPADPGEGGGEAPAEPGEGGGEAPAEPGEGGEETPADPGEGGEETPADPGEGGEEAPADPGEGGEGAPVLPSGSGGEITRFEPTEDSGVVNEGKGRFGISVTDRPLRELLEALFETSGRSLPLDLAMTAPPVKLGLKGASFWQAVDEICRAGDAFLWGAFVPAGARLRSRTGGGDLHPPVAYDGPIRSSLESVVSRVAFGPCEAGKPPLEVKVWVLPEPGVRLLGRPGLGPLAKTVSFEASDDQGTDLGTGRAYLSRIGNGFQLTLFLAAPAPEAKGLSRVAIVLDLSLVGALEEVEVLDVATKVGEEVEAGALRLRIDEVKAERVAFTVRGEGKRGERRFVRSGTAAPPGIRLVDGEGNPVPLAGYKIEGEGDELRYTLDGLEGFPEGLSLIYNAVKGREKRTFRFEFKDIPLTK